MVTSIVPGASAPVPEHVTLPRHVIYGLQFALAQTAARLERVVSTPPGRIDETILANSRLALSGLNAALETARRTAALHQLTFQALREANVARLPTLRNAQGAPIHSTNDGSDVALAHWLVALAGEVGELCNWHKKHLRGDLTLAEFTAEAARECGDIADYLDIVAMRIGVDLGRAVADKFNEVSERFGSNVRLTGDSWVRVRTAVQGSLW